MATRPRPLTPKAGITKDGRRLYGKGGKIKSKKKSK